MIWKGNYYYCLFISVAIDDQYCCETSKCETCNWSNCVRHMLLSIKQKYIHRVRSFRTLWSLFSRDKIIEAQLQPYRDTMKLLDERCERRIRYISSPTYKNVVTQFLAGNFYCKCGIYNAKSMFCHKHRTFRPIRSRDVDRSVFYQKVVCPWSYQKVVCHWIISPLYLYDNDICMSLL